MIPSVVIACEFDPELYFNTIICLEVPQKTFEEDIALVFDIKPEQAMEFFQKMYVQAKVHKKYDSAYKAMRGLVRNVWFLPFEKKCHRLSDPYPRVDAQFYLNDYLYLLKLPDRYLPSEVRDMYFTLLEKDKQTNS
jgi:hypothetical protein